MKLKRQPNDEAAILSRVIEPNSATLAPAVAEALLAIDFPREDRDRMQKLAAKAQSGNLTIEEQNEIDTYGRVGSLLSILQAKARFSLKGLGDTKSQEEVNCHAAPLGKADMAKGGAVL